MNRDQLSVMLVNLSLKLFSTISLWQMSLFDSLKVIEEHNKERAGDIGDYKIKEAIKTFPLLAYKSHFVNQNKQTKIFFNLLQI